MISLDKLLHFLCGFAIGSTLSFAPLGAILCVAMIGTAKEGYDFLYNKYFKIAHEVSYFDFLATVIGGIVGIIAPVAALYFFTNFPILLGM